MKTNIILILIIAGLSLGLFFCIDLVKTEKANSKRNYDNIEAMVKGLKLSNDSTRAETKIINHKVSEVADLYPQIKDIAREMNVRVKDIKMYQETQMQINAHFLSTVRNALINGDSAKIATYSDKYISFMLEMFSDTTKKAPTNIEIPVELNQLVTKKKKDGFWGYFQKKDLIQIIKTDNPYVKLKYNKVINIEK